MHISDGILSGPVCAAGYAIAGIITVVSLKKMDRNTVPKTALATAAFFIASLVHIRIGPTSIHLLLTGFTGILLGMAAIPAILVGLLFQAIMLGHGGLSSLGVNTVCMGLPALIASALFKAGQLIPGKRFQPVIAFTCGVVSVLLGITLVAAALAISDKSFIPFVRIAVGVHLILGIIEGTMCMLLTGFIQKVKPSLLRSRE